MKFSAFTTMFMVAGTAMAAGNSEYTLTCSRAMNSGPNDDQSALAYFTKLYTMICIQVAHCEHSVAPLLGALGSVVSGGCIGCAPGLRTDLFGDCLLASVSGQ
ncbi:hypothetical protein E4U55_004639 [Claviceps digitariae]|nr:hypothetical protein E4U55_004639 [Claviceps digitariae]